jgi:hypothetical protein
MGTCKVHQQRVPNSNQQEPCQTVYNPKKPPMAASKALKNEPSRLDQRNESVKQLAEHPLGSCDSSHPKPVRMRSPDRCFDKAQSRICFAKNNVNALRVER